MLALALRDLYYFAPYIQEHLSLLGEEKYGPGSEPQWKAGGTRYPNLYKALLEEPSSTRRTKLLEDIPRGKIGDGRIIGRPARTRIRNQ